MGEHPQEATITTMLVRVERNFSTVMWRLMGEWAIPMAMRRPISMMMRRLMRESAIAKTMRRPISKVMRMRDRRVIGIAPVIQRRTISQVLMVITRNQRGPL